MRKHLVKFCVIVLLVAVVSAGVGQILAKKPGGSGCPTPQPGCFCPTYYEPVICNGDCVYSNMCFAQCAKARHCVPLGPGPIPL